MTYRLPLVSGFFLGLLASLSAAPIHWETPVNLNEGIAVVSTNGTYVEGLNLQDYTSSLVNVTINGVTFFGGKPPTGGTDPSSLAYTSSFGGFSVSGHDRDGHSDYSGDGEYSAAASEMQALVKEGQWSPGFPITVTMNNLTMGAEYEVQLFVNDSRSANTSAAVYDDGLGNVVTVRFNASNQVGGLGQVVTGTFTADATTQSVISTMASNRQINAIQLRVLADDLPQAAIIWEEPKTVTGPSDVSTDGVYVEALNIQDVHSAATNTEVGDVTFFGHRHAGDGSATTSPFGAFVFGADLTGNGYDGFGSTASPFADLDQGTRAVMAEGISRIDGTPWTLTLSNLEVGAEYQIQVWANDSRAAGVDRATEIADPLGNVGTINLNTAPGNTEGGVGQVILGTFTADEASLDLTVQGVNRQINALQLRRLSGGSGGGSNTEGSVASDPAFPAGHPVALYTFAGGSLEDTADTTAPGVSSVSAISLSDTAQAQRVTETGFENTLRFAADQVTLDPTGRYLQFTISFDGSPDYDTVVLRFEHEQSVTHAGNASTFEAYLVASDATERKIKTSTVTGTPTVAFSSSVGLATSTARIDPEDSLTIRLYVSDYLDNPGTNFGLTWLAVSLQEPIQHPFLLYRDEDVAGLRELSANPPYSNWKNKAIDHANTQSVAPGDNHYLVRNLAQSSALAYILDPVGVDRYTAKFMQAVNSWPGTLDAINPESGDWGENIPPAASLVGTIVAYDAIYNGLTDAERMTADSVLEESVNRIQLTHHKRSYYGLHYVWNRFRGASEEAAADLEEFKARVFRVGNDPWLQASAPGYEWARSAGGDRAQSKALPMDIASHIGDHDFYLDPRMISYFDFLVNFTMGPAGSLNAFGDSDPFGSQAFFNSYRHFSFGKWGSDIARTFNWYAETTPETQGGLIGEAIAQYVLYTPQNWTTAPVSRAWESVGANLWAKNPNQKSLQGSLWSMTLAPEHDHLDANAITLHAYGKTLLANSGYGGFGADQPTVSWADSTGQAWTNNTVTFNGENHVSPVGGGVTAQNFNGVIDYATASSGESMGATSVHRRTLALVNPGADVKGYFVVVDAFDRPGFNGEVQTYWHPPGSLVSELEVSRHYRYDLPGYDDLDIYMSRAARVSILEGGTATFVSGLKTRPEKMIQATHPINDGGGSTATVFFPSTRLVNPPSLMGNSDGDETTIRLDFGSGITDTIAVNSESRTSALDQVDWVGDALIYRLNEGSEELFSRAMGIGITRLERRGIGVSGEEPFDILVDEGRVEITTAQIQKIVLRGIQPDSLTVNGDAGHPHAIHGGRVEIEVPGGRVELSYTSGTDARLANLSNRGLVATGAGVMIPGFVLSGSGTREILVRAVGPGLQAFGVSNVLADPMIQLFDGSNEIQSNDNWETGNDADEIGQVFQRLGAFPLEGGARDAALMAELPVGAYTVKASGVGDTTGVSLVELYDAGDLNAASSVRMSNLSNRGFVGVRGAIMIPGFVIQGDLPRTVLVRAIGPGLEAFGLTGFLADARLTVYAGAEVIAENNDWWDQTNTSALVQATATVGAFELDASSKDAALLLTLDPGSYTVQASGLEETSGIALVELYLVP